MGGVPLLSRQHHAKDWIEKNILGWFPSLIIYIDLVVTLLQVAEKSAQIQQEASTNMEGISHDLVQERTKTIS